MAWNQGHKKRIITGLAFIMILGGLNYIFKWYMLMIIGAGCVERPFYTTVSPNGVHIATEFERNCGATVQTAVHVNLRDRSAPFTTVEGGAITEGTVLSRLDSDHFKVKWIDNKKLEITGPSDKILEKKNLYKGITIKFKFIELKTDPADKIEKNKAMFLLSIEK
jgi:hypothetical protein